MPDFATIDSGSSALNNQAGLSECVGTLQVQNDWIAGQYSHPFGSFEANANEPYFLFNTRTGAKHDFSTRDALQAQVPQPLHLQPVTAFQSQDPAYRREHLLNELVAVAPMITAALGYALLVLRARSRSHASVRRTSTA